MKKRSFIKHFIIKCYNSLFHSCICKSHVNIYIISFFYIINNNTILVIFLLIIYCSYPMHFNNMLQTSILLLRCSLNTPNLSFNPVLYQDQNDFNNTDCLFFSCKRFNCIHKISHVHTSRYCFLSITAIFGYFHRFL